MLCSDFIDKLSVEVQVRADMSRSSGFELTHQAGFPPTETFVQASLYIELMILFVCLFICLLQRANHLQQKDQTVVPATARSDLTYYSLWVFREQTLGILELGHIFQRNVALG